MKYETTKKVVVVSDRTLPVPPGPIEAAKRSNDSKSESIEFTAADDIDVMCNDIYKRKRNNGCLHFPLCLCGKTPCENGIGTIGSE